MKKFEITKKEAFFLGAFSLFILLIIIIGYFTNVKIFYQLSIFFLVIFILVCIFEVYKRLNRHLELIHNNLIRKGDNDYHQLEALFSLFFSIKPKIPFPETRKGAASPDLLKFIYKTIYYNKPDLVLEASSGISTLIIAYCLKNIGKGKVISLEHDQKYANITREYICLHDLVEIASIIHAPLKEFKINNETFLWYSLDNLKLDKPIDLLVVDGPPASTQYMARYPALPLLHKSMNGQSQIILYGGIREDEKKIVQRWITEFDCIKEKYINFEKNAFYIEIDKGKC
jgi:hypothetical protein